MVGGRKKERKVGHGWEIFDLQLQGSSGGVLAYISLSLTLTPHDNLHPGPGCKSVVVIAKEQYTNPLSILKQCYNNFVIIFSRRT